MRLGHHSERAGPVRSAPLLTRVRDALRRRPRRFGLVTGCPRSGTTAVIEWLARLHGVTAFNESRILLAAHQLLGEVDRFTVLRRRQPHVARLARALVLAHYGSVARRSGDLIIDKEPLEPIALPAGDYAAFLRSVRSLFPAARVLYLVRDPVPTIWSMLGRRWGHTLADAEPREFSLEECLSIWKANTTLAAGLRPDPTVLVCRFEDLAAEPDPVSRRILAFFGIPDARPFQPRPTAEVRFEPEVRERIVAATATERGYFNY